MYFDWDPEKNKKLIHERGVSFEMCLALIKQGDIFAMHTNKSPREHQTMFVLIINEYAHIVPAVVNEDSIFLKTIYPSRKWQKEYLKKYEN